MSPNFFRRLSVVALVLSAVIPFSTLHAQSVLEQLQAQYPLARGTDGCHIGNPETALVTQSPGGGMRILPVSSEMKIAKCVNSYADGKLTPANSACNGESVGKVGGWMSHIPGRVGNAAGAGSNKVNDQAAKQQMDVVATGDKVYPTNVDVNESKGEVKFTVITCKQAGDQSNPYKGELVFKFKSLKPENVSQVEDAISQVFKQDDQGNNGGGNGQQGNDNGGGPQSNNGNQDQGGQQQDNQASACNPEVGQTIKQVTDACGQPANQTKGATKVLYFYNQPKIKVTFVGGKVSDIE